MNIVHCVCVRVIVMRLPIFGEGADTAVPQIPPALCTVECTTAPVRAVHSPLLPHTLHTHPTPTHTPSQTLQWRQQHGQHLRKTERGDC